VRNYRHHRTHPEKEEEWEMVHDMLIDHIQAPNVSGHGQQVLEHWRQSLNVRGELAAMEPGGEVEEPSALVQAQLVVVVPVPLEDHLAEVVASRPSTGGDQTDLWHSGCLGSFPGLALRLLVCVQ
jgi:hypothetical protein